MINILVTNRLGNFGDTLLGVKIGQDSITWGKEERDPKTCLTFPQHGFYKRSNEKSVLPHAIGCQRPSATWDYRSVLEGTVDHKNTFKGQILQKYFQYGLDFKVKTSWSKFHVQINRCSC